MIFSVDENPNTNVEHINDFFLNEGDVSKLYRTTYTCDRVFLKVSGAYSLLSRLTDEVLGPTSYSRLPQSCCREVMRST